MNAYDHDRLFVQISVLPRCFKMRSDRTESTIHKIITASELHVADWYKYGQGPM
jgi:hypothetical protein